MKKAYFVAVLLVVALAVPSLSFAAKKGPTTPDKTYTNGDYKFRLNYPGAWNYEEQEKPKAVFKMCSVKFGENLKDENDPNINLVVISWKEPKAEKSKREEKRAEKAEKEKEDCVIVEQKSVKWAGQKAMLMTTRCPETKKVSVAGSKKKRVTVWRYTTAVNMKRSQDMYNMVGQMLCTTSGDGLCDDLVDKGKSQEFDKKLKPARDKIIATTKFIK